MSSVVYPQNHIDCIIVVCNQDPSEGNAKCQQVLGDKFVQVVSINAYFATPCKFY